MAIVTYIVEYSDVMWEMKVALDEDATTPWQKKDKSFFTLKECIKEMVEFWTDWESDVEENEGDYTKTFLQSLAIECYRIIVSNNYNTFGVISEFDDKEGWCKMDGSFGIKIIDCDDVNFSNSSFEVKVEK